MGELAYRELENRERRLRFLEAIRNPDGTLTVKFRAGGAREMDWHLYTWGGHVKVIKPEDFDKRKEYICS